MEKNLYIDASHPNETRVVLKSENGIEDYEYEGLKNNLIKNNIYLGKVSRIEPSLQAAFVDFGRERHGFLSFNDIQSDYYQIPKSDLEIIKKEEEKAREELSKEVEEKEEKDLAEGKDKTIAAIASDLSAKMYNLKILQKNIEDDKGNVTRFLIMGKNIEQPEYDKNKKYITSCIFRVKSEPSALYKCLGGFATNQVNLTKLESFSVKNTFDQANFYLDLEGHLEEAGVKKALEELGFHTETLDILGVYESSTFRQK